MQLCDYPVIWSVEQYQDQLVDFALIRNQDKKLQGRDGKTHSFVCDWQTITLIFVLINVSFIFCDESKISSRKKII